MAITMQGAWTVTVASKNAAFAQRFVISRSGVADLVVAGVPGNAVFVDAPQWSVNVQHQAGAGQPWVDSAQRIGYPTVAGGLLHYNINTDDGGGAGGGDKDYNDLVLTCSMPISATDFVVYGNARTYSGPCPWNPCYPFYYAIETLAQLQKALEVPDLRAIIAKLYPERLPRRGPIPDPGPLFSKLLLPKAAPVTQNGLVFRSAALRAAAPQKAIATAEEASAYHATAVSRLGGSASVATFDGAPISAGSALLDRADVLALARLADRYRVYWNCSTQAAPGLLLRFEEYDRTDSEKAGGSYSGAGPREVLGLSSTDELGNYVFRFSRSLTDLVDETLDVGPGESLATQIFPDVIAQVLGSTMDVDFETSVYYNVPNLVRIDLCMPFQAVHPSNPNCTGLDRILTRIGDIVVQHAAIGGSPNLLTADGRITSGNANGPSVQCAAWRNIAAGGRTGLSLYACMTAPQVASYTLRHSQTADWSGPAGGTWQYVSQSHSLIYVPLLGSPGYAGSPVGPVNRAVHLDGGAPTVATTYDNHGGDSLWIESDLKMILDTAIYRAANAPGTVYFRLQGYDAAGNLVPGVDDTIALYIANQPSTGKIFAVDLGSPADDDCTLLTLPGVNPAAPVYVRYEVQNPDGFLQSWNLSVTRGNNNAVVTSAGGVLPTSYPAGLSACNFRGTPDFAVDGDGHTVTSLAPQGGSWLPAGKTFCAFQFLLTATDRVTDGRNAYPTTVWWPDLVGINA